MPVNTLPPPSIAAAAPTRFAPAIASPYRYRIEQVRDEGGVIRRYASERTLRFFPDGNGLIGELTVDSAVGGSADGPGAMFERIFAGLIGRTIRYRVSNSGVVTGVEELDAVWAQLVAGIAAQGSDDPVRMAMAHRLAGSFRDMTTQQRTAFLGSMLSSMIATQVTQSGVQPAKPFRQVGKPPFGTGSVVAGSERVWARGDGLLIQERTVAGDIGVPGAAGRRTETLVRAVDPATGVVHEQVETTRTQIANATSVATTRISLRRPHGI